MSGRPDAGAVLEYWLGPAPDDPGSAETRQDLWYRGGRPVDAEITRRFGDLVARAVQGDSELLAWEDTAPGAAALVVLLDQFTRSIYRASAQAWSGDARALGIARRAVAAGADRTLPVTARLFLYHPYHHAEDPREQDEAVRLFERLRRDAGPGWSEYLGRTCEYARGHRDIVVRFGRFPHRNAVLGRSSTPEERAFLEGNPESYGQGR